jgi:glyoxylase-like metal-dependent hydrolase (beta-lactamase superfamily II)
MLLARIAAAAFSLPLLLVSQPSADAQVKPGLERLYVIDCGHADIPDISRWTPGANAGVSAKFSDNCYLIKHAQGWMLWDTGLADSIATNPPPAQPGAPVWRRATTLAAELEKLGVKPGDIKFVAVSHTHGDHAGNVELFPQQMLLVQKAEYDWPGADGKPRFVASHPVTKLEGDHDVFGDGSVTIISTPGHTPGHQSLMVKLPETGVVLLSGDAVHFRENWDAKRIPGFNVDQAKSATSMQRLADLVAEHKAQLWINHDKAQSDTMKRSPQFYQ